MRIDDYGFEDAATAEFERLVQNRPLRAERLVDELERFVQRNTDPSARIYPNPNGRPVEVFMVPAPWILRHMPDAAVLVAVHHATKKIKAIRVYEDSDGDNSPAGHWAEVNHVAATYVNSNP